MHVMMAADGESHLAACEGLGLVRKISVGCGWVCVVECEWAKPRPWKVEQASLDLLHNVIKLLQYCINKILFVCSVVVAWISKLMQ